MTRITCQQSVSLDGYSAGPDQRLDEPLGTGGEQLHDWYYGDHVEAVDRELGAHLFDGIGAHVMGRKMFGGGPGPWDETWRGWWGDDPPYRVPVFVVTHHPREPLTLGATTFHFVTDGVDAALDRAVEAAGDRDVAVAGGASTIQQALRAGRVDELLLHVVPIVLGGGERLLDDVGDLRLELVETIASPAVTHVRYAVRR